MKCLVLEAKKILDPETGFNFNRFSTLKERSGMHGHDFYEFFILTRGSIIHHINNTRQLITECTLVFIRPGDVHLYEEIPGEAFEIINIAFAEDTFRKLIHYLGDGFEKNSFDEAGMPPQAIMTMEELEEMNDCFEKLCHLLPSEKYRATTLMRALLAKCIIRYFLHRGRAAHTLPLWLEAALNRMNHKNNLMAGLPALIRFSGKSHEYLCSVFRKYFNQTPTEYINGLRLNYSRNLLINTDMTIVEVAENAGFENLSHFYHRFKKKFGTSPLQLRKAVQRPFIS